MSAQQRPMSAARRARLEARGLPLLWCLALGVGVALMAAVEGGALL